MGRSRFVRPDIRRLELSEGDWIEVKGTLTAGERAALNSASLQTSVRPRVPGMLEEINTSQEVRVDFGRASLARMEMYITDWSFRDEKDKPVKVSRAAIAALDQETADEIEAALDKHVTEQAEAKKAMTGTPTPEDRSESCDSCVGGGET